MKTMLFILMILINQSAFAGTIYKCKNAKGVVIFQQVACLAGQGVGAKSFQRVPDSPNRASTEALEEQLERLEAIVAEQKQASPPNARPSYVEEESSPSGYACNDGRSEWVQSDPCPTSVSHNEARMFNGHTNAGVPVQGFATQRVMRPVEQKGLSTSEMCERLRNNPVIKSRGAKASSTYERNKMRDTSGC